MPANVYECMFLLDTTKVGGDVPTAAKQLHGILEKNHAEILASRPWDERRLAFSIDNHKKGLYYLTYFRSEGKNLRPIEHDVSLNEMIIRSLVIKIEPKLVDTMLALARDEHALALHVASADETEEGGMEGGDDFRGGPRRGGRRPIEAGMEDR
jgi:small subunit ribosomal protein S6